MLTNILNRIKKSINLVFCYSDQQVKILENQKRNLAARMNNHIDSNIKYSDYIANLIKNM